MDLSQQPAADALVARLLARAERRGMTQQDLADRMGMSQPAISNLIKRKSNIHFLTFMRLAAAVGAVVGMDPCPHCEDKPPYGFRCETCGATSNLT